MTGWIRGFIEVYHARADVGFEVAFEWSAAAGDRSEVTGTNEDCHGFSYFLDSNIADIRLS